MQGIVFEVYEGVPAQDKSNLKATITTGTDGVATESKLPVYDATGAKIQYYIVETNVSGEYTVDYPGNSNDYWGPIELSATSRTTNLTNTPVVNRKNDTAITIKTSNPSAAESAPDS